MKLSIIGAIFLLVLTQFSSAYKILFMGPFPAPSHWLWLEHFVNELVSRGHQVTTITNFPSKQPNENLTEIILNPKFDIPKYYPKSSIFNMRFSSDFQNLQMWWELGVRTSEYALNNAKVKKFIQSDEKFDLIILEQFFHESFLMFAHKFNAPIVTIGTMGYADNMDHTMGLLTPLSIVPHLLLSYTDNMSFKERAYNTYLSLYDYVFRRWHYMPQMQDMAERHFKDAIKGPLPSVRDLEKNISLMLVNSHRSLDLPRPSMPGLVDIGGIHIKPAKPLPKDLKEFIDNSKNGVIYFSLGSYMKSTDMPPEKIQIILKAFSKVKQNVLWKYEDDSIKNLPKNVMIKKWMPQNDILAHKNVILFITHGGLFGTQEGTHWGKPMLCIPLYGDQHRNTIKAVREGYALSLVFSALTETKIITMIKELTENPQYTHKAKELSALFRDNPIHPKDEAMFWIEYVIRNKGAPKLKSYGVHVPFYKYLLLDVFFVFLGCVCIIFILTFKILKFVISIFKKTQPSKTKNE
ncbi:UDP-glucosyltransferase 2 [Eupeodes corollae]|uniref:UDP-glucosyltransferase 2 n=1 Tax=Eupeodes corollae TaxID=290404 RepID=UPI00248FBC72|nr:UDP-glucosyltransferase 2 [Eupeodes corollae]XP_055917570.1 UDP-glucosyltransferase 2 [Eupeodes corollae]